LGLAAILQYSFQLGKIGGIYFIPLASTVHHRLLCLNDIKHKQAGAELGQAQVQLGLAMLAVTRKMAYLLQILGHIPFQKKFIIKFIIKY
jgi:hypothetical protein